VRTAAQFSALVLSCEAPLWTPALSAGRITGNMSHLHPPMDHQIWRFGCMNLMIPVGLGHSCAKPKNWRGSSQLWSPALSPPGTDFRLPRKSEVRILPQKNMRVRGGTHKLSKWSSVVWEMRFAPGQNSFFGFWKLSEIFRMRKIRSRNSGLGTRRGGRGGAAARPLQHRHGVFYDYRKKIGKKDKKISFNFY
jgi:hypothetical protein